jgi:ABC-2 type transport system permease protein
MKDINETAVAREETINSNEDLQLVNSEDNSEIDEKIAKKPKKKLSVAIKDSFKSRKFKSGAYSTIISAVVIVIVLVINLIAGELDLKVDLSNDSLYTLTDITKKLVKNTKDDITIYYIAGEDSQMDQVKEIVNKYKNLSDNIKVELKDPVLYPNFTSQYTTEDVTENSVIVVNNTTDTYKYVPYSDMLQYDYDSSYNPYVTGVDVEGQITSAIQYVTSKDLPIIYSLEGHNETAFGTTITGLLKKHNITLNTVNLLSEESIPEDCSLLVINGPVYDFSEDEVNKVKDYLEGGGKAIILASYSKEAMPNFDELLEYYGVKLNEGVVVEEDKNHYMSTNQAYLIPTVESHDITEEVANNNKAVVIPISKGISQVDTLRSTIKVENLLTTSEDAFSKLDVNSATYERDKNDVDGPFSLGILATDTYNNVESKVVVYSSPYLIDESMAAYNQLGNADLFISTVNYLTEKTNSLSIPVRSVEESYVTLTSAQVNMWGAFAVFLIPGIFIVTGIVVTLKRRKR